MSKPLSDLDFFLVKCDTPLHSNKVQSRRWVGRLHNAGWSNVNHPTPISHLKYTRVAAISKWRLYKVLVYEHHPCTRDLLRRKFSCARSVLLLQPLRRHLQLLVWVKFITDRRSQLPGSLHSVVTPYIQAVHILIPCPTVFWRRRPLDNVFIRKLCGFIQLIAREVGVTFYIP